ncbi:hypothetical protein [Roseibium sediminicola]|uniref:Uncharacterized protein n=1 Tax=Roseibium sediminicola TaxID=2933272 RepID=A0ABT0GRB6_9HYPH|nr:hypothetical protein [Roseibium sp. CAU 1639]MCK7611977.1 hypothetical protein [Roseibium sp. CAU 1639]
MTTHADENAVVSKGAFADILGVSAGRVSQYISEGKIFGPALVGEGRRAQINVPVAREQLRRALDIGQMLGNGIDTRLSASPVPGGLPFDVAPAPAQPAMTSPAPPQDPRSDSVEDQLKRQRLFQEQIRSRKAAEEEEERKGRFTITQEVQSTNRRIAVEMIQTFEGSLPNMAAAVASHFEVPVRDVLHLLRGEFTQMRSRAAEKAREKGADLPETIETEITTDDEDETD